MHSWKYGNFVCAFGTTVLKMRMRIWNYGNRAMRVQNNVTFSAHARDEITVPV